MRFSWNHSTNEHGKRKMYGRDPLDYGRGHGNMPHRLCLHGMSAANADFFSCVLIKGKLHLFKRNKC